MLQSVTLILNRADKCNTKCIQRLLSHALTIIMTIYKQSKVYWNRCLILCGIMLKRAAGAFCENKIPLSFIFNGTWLWGFIYILPFPSEKQLVYSFKKIKLYFFIKLHNWQACMHTAFFTVLAYDVWLGVLSLYTPFGIIY